MATKDQIPEGFFDIFRVAELPSTHQGVFVKEDSKAIRETADQGFLCFGQYKKGYPTIPLQAVFSILIEDNTRDDRYVVVLDVCDHHSDRVIGKRVITRKDFPKANAYCLFTFDFTPPSQDANMEFRIYYMGYANVQANRIAVIDPAKVTVTDPSQLLVTPSPEPHPEPPEEDDKLPEPWQIKKLGNSDGKVTHTEIVRGGVIKKGMFEYVARFKVEAKGKFPNDLYFLYHKWSDKSANGKLVVKFSGREDAVGVMFRETLEPDSPFVMLKNNRVLYRKRRGGGVTEKQVVGEGKRIYGLRLSRKRQGSEQFFQLHFSTVSSGAFNVGDQVTLSMPQEIYAGVVSGTAKSYFVIETQYKDSNAKK